MTICKDFTFDCAHHLPKMPEGHKCRRPHGHTYRMTVFVTGKPDPETGIIIDYADIARAVDPVVEALDHHNLNLIAGLENPTTEVLIVWVWNRLVRTLPMLSRIEILESSTTCCIYEGE